MRAIITGGCGFVGQHLVARLVRDGVSVVVLDALTRAASGRDKVSGLARLVVGDVADARAVDAALALAGRPTVVYHLAAESHVDESLRHPGPAMRANGEGTLTVALACARAGVPLVYCSTDEVYGDAEGRVRGFDEDDPPAPSSPYAAGKVAGEMAVRAAVRSYGLRAVITRGSNAFGPGQCPEKLVPIACRLLQRGEPVPLHGGGDQVRQWLHVEDFVDGLCAAAWSLKVDAACRTGVPLRVFNLAGPRRCSVRELVGALAREAGSAHTGVEVPDRPGQDRAYWVSGARTCAALNFRPKRDILAPAEIRALLEAYPADGDVRLAAWGA